MVEGVISGVIEERKRTRDGAVITRRFRVVCASCNNGWMSGIESRAKEILRLLIIGGEGVLDSEMQQQLAIWMTLKTIVGEQGRPLETVVTQGEREAFKNSGIVPISFRIWAGRCLSNRWHSAWLRTAGTIGEYIDDNPPKEIPTGPNIQTTSLGVGELFLYARVVQTTEIKLNNEEISEHLVPIFPGPVPDLRLPNRCVITHETAERIANALDQKLRQIPAAEVADDGSVMIRPRSA